MNNYIPVVHINDPDAQCEFCWRKLKDNHRYYGLDCGHLYCYFCMTTQPLLNICTRCNQAFIAAFPVLARVPIWIDLPANFQAQEVDDEEDVLADVVVNNNATVNNNNAAEDDRDYCVVVENTAIDRTDNDSDSDYVFNEDEDDEE